MSENYTTEEQLQADCFKWFDNEFPSERRMLFAVPNGGKRPMKRMFIQGQWKMIPVEGNKLKATGTIGGPSDFIFVCGTVIFIEIKLPGKTQSDDQIDFMNKVTVRGHQYIVMEYFWEFKRFIIRKLSEYERIQQ